MSKTMEQIAALQKERHFILIEIGKLSSAMSVHAKPLLEKLIKVQKELQE